MTLEWAYTPPDYFDRAVEFDASAYRITIRGGKARATGNSQAGTDVEDALLIEIRTRFEAHLCLGHQYLPFNISCVPVRIDAPADAKVKYVHISAQCTTQVGIKKRIAGYQDTIKYRENADFSRLLLAHRLDDTLVKMLQSLQQAARENQQSASIDSRTNELSHLYEIREAVAARFGSEQCTLKSLSVTETSWRRFGKICNNTPQGRHRGKVKTPEPATPDDLNFARSVAMSLIRKYVHYIDS